LDSLKRLVGEFSRLPGVGPKTAARLAHHILRISPAEAGALAEAILEVKERLFHCSRCQAITDIDPCRYCTDQERRNDLLCIVEQPYNIDPLERTGEYRGRYHVLLGALSPLRGIGPEQLAIDGLFSRLEGVQEVILATNPNVEGEATAHYLARRLSSFPVTVTRLAFGMPVGGDIEFTDEVTLSRSLRGRRAIGS
jgi:recombination protein RecR